MNTSPRSNRPRPADHRQMVWILATGVSFAIAATGILGWLFLRQPESFFKIVTVVGAMFFGGRIPGILTGIELGMGNLGTILILSATNTTWFCLVFPALSNVSRHIASSRWVERLFHRAEERANQQVGRVSALGAWGLPIFVWLPLPLTGAVVGAVLGLILRMPRVRVFAVVLTSMWVGVITWTFAFDSLFLFTGRAGKTAAWILTVAFLLYSLYGHRRTHR